MDATIDNLLAAGRIAWAHLAGFPDWHTHPDRLDVEWTLAERHA